MEAKEKKVEQKPWKGARMFGERKKKGRREKGNHRLAPPKKVGDPNDP